MPAARRPSSSPKKKSSSPAQAPRARPAEREEVADETARRLAAAIPEPKSDLDFADGFQLLVATILSAQSNDKTINRVTPLLFARFPTPRALAEASAEEVEDIVRPTGFYRNKAKAIRGMSAALVARHGGDVPRTLEELVELPGVARKTANVVLGSAFGIPSGIVVDTHAGRVSRRLRLTCEEDPGKVERDLCALFPKESWIDVGHRLVLHGRYVCTAKKPRCAACPLNEVCASREQEPEGPWQERARREAQVVASRGEA